VIQLRHQQPSLWEGLFAQEEAELWEPWMRVVDELLEDDELLEAVYQAQGKRHGRSRTRGRRQTPAEVALRMLILKHVRNWSYEIVEREVRANVVYRSFCRIGMAKVPDEKTLLRLGQAIGPETIRELHDRIVDLAQERRVIQGRKLRVDTTVVESNIHYPTDSGLLNDGARVLTRTMQQIEQKAGRLKKKVRNRMRSVTKRVIAIAHALRHKGPEGELKRKKEYRQLLRVTRQILNDSRRVLQEVAALPTRRRCGVRQLGERLETMAEQVRRVLRQTKARVFDGLTQFPGKLVSLFEPQSEIIRKGKAGKPNEFGKLVQLQEAENQIITHYEVYDERPSGPALTASGSGSASAQVRANATMGGGGCWLLLARQRGRGARSGREVRVGPQPKYTPRRTTPTGEAALVQAGSEVEDGMRRTDQCGQAAARVSALPLPRS
jgi:transposase, IS5 family